MAPMNGTSALCQWTNPTGPYVVTQSFGPTSVVGEPICNGSQTHRGIDLGVPAGTPTIVPASLSGKFLVNTQTVSQSGGYGNLIIVRSVPMNGDLFDVYLAHHSSVIVSNGQQVSPGDRLGLTGSTGFSSGPHLHFEVRPKGSSSTCSSVDPTQMMQDPTGTGSAQLDNATLLNGGLDLNPLDALSGIGTAITKAEQDFIRTATAFAAGGVGIVLAGGGTVAAMYMLRGSSPNVGQIAAKLITPGNAPTPAPKAPPAPRQRQYTPTERKWNPRKMVEPPTVESVAAKVRANQKLSPAEVMFGNQNQAALGQAIAKLK